MRKAKSILAIFLVFSIVFLCGCSNISAILNKIDSDYYEITAISKNAESYSAVDVSGDNILFLTYSGIDKCVLFVYNVQKNKVIAKSTLDDSGLETITKAEFTSENEIMVYDDINEKAVAYDLALNKTGNAEYQREYFDSDNLPQSDLITGEFDHRDNYAVCYDENKTTCIFYDDVNKCFIINNDNTNFIDDYDKSILKSGYIEDDKFFTVSIDNYKDAVNSGEIRFEAEKGLSQNVTFGKMNDRYAVFVLEISNDNTGGMMSVPYIWKYNKNPLNAKLDLTIRSKAEINEENEKIIKDIKNKYNIRVTCGEVIEGYHEDETEYSINPLEQNTMLKNLSECLPLLPDGFIKELYDYNEMVSGLRINLVKSIDSIDAYVVDYLEEMTVVFGYYSLRQGTGVFFHEFMHLIDNRLTDYYWENYGYDFYDEWCKLNPKDFEYLGDEYHDADDKKYFVSNYATKNMEEDTADTLRYLCEKVEYGNDEEEGYGEDDTEEKYGENVIKKTELLCKAIREAFPSAANAEELYWEKGLNK